MVGSIPDEGGLAGGGGWVLEQEDIELYLLVDRIWVGDGRKGELHGELGGLAAMACDGGVPGARAGARPGSRRCGAKRGGLGREESQRGDELRPAR